MMTFQGLDESLQVVIRTVVAEFYGKDAEACDTYAAIEEDGTSYIHVGICHSPDAAPFRVRDSNTMADELMAQLSASGEDRLPVVEHFFVDERQSIEGFEDACRAA